MSQHDASGTASEGRRRLEVGNRDFVASGDIGDQPGAVAPQRPFAAVLGCSDARVPLEQVFHQAWNDIFVMEVAGNGLSAEMMGSLQYAVMHLKSVGIAAVVGHTSCGGVSATVDAWLDPSNYLSLVPTPELRAIVDRGLISARAASEYLEGVYGSAVVEREGYRAALIETTAVVNAANSARMMRDQVRPLRADLEVCFGVYDIASRIVGVTPDDPGLAEAPTDAAAFDAVGFQVAESAMIRRLLDG